MSKLTQTQVDFLWSQRTTSNKEKKDNVFFCYCFYSKLEGMLYSLSYPVSGGIITDETTAEEIQGIVKADLLLIDYKGVSPIETETHI